MHRDDEHLTDETITSPAGDPGATAESEDTGASSVPSGSTDEPERASFSDPLPARSHALDPSVADSQESREQAPPSPEWLKEGVSSERSGA